MITPLLIVRSLRRRRVAATLTTLSVALGVMLVSSVLLLRSQLDQRFSEPGRGYGLVVGAPGSALTLVLSTVYHVEQSPGLMPFSVYRELSEHPSTRLAVPCAVGDSFRGHPVVGTTPAFFSPNMPYPAATTTERKFAEGRPFRFDAHSLDDALAELHSSESAGGHDHDHDDSAVFEAVIGAEVQRRLGIRIGDRIEPTHGAGNSSIAHAHEQLWEVVGILERTRTAVDRLVLINLDSFYRIGEHAEGSIVPGTNEPGLSAVLLFPKGGMHKAMLAARLRKRSDLQVAEVDTEIRKLMGIVGNVDGLFLLVAGLVTVIGLASILVSVYNTMNERRREVAVLRAIGVHRRVVTLAVVAEAAALAGAGALLGVVFAHGLVATTAGRIEAVAGFMPSATTPIVEELLVVALVTIGGAFAGLAPAWQAYRTDVASNLAPTS